MISPFSIQKIQDRLDIVELIGNFIQLKKNYAIILFLLIITNLCIAQPFTKNIYGIVESTKFKEFIKDKNYQIVGSFENLKSMSRNSCLADVIYKNNKYLLDTNGKLSTKAELDSIYFSKPHSCIVYTSEAKRNTNIINAEKEIIKISEFDLTTKNNKVGTINKINNKIGLEPIFDEIHYRSKDIVIIKKDTLFGLANVNGKILIPPIFDKIEQIGGFDGFSKSAKINNGFVYLSKGKLGYINNDFNIVTKAIYSEIDIPNNCFFSEEKPKNIFVSINGQKGLINKYGKVILQIKYKECSDVDNNGLIKIKTFDINNESYGNKEGLIDTNGNIILTPNNYSIWKYYSVDHFYELNTKYSIKDGEKYKIFYKNNNKYIIAEFDNLISTDSGGAIFKIKNKYGILDTNGNVLIEPIFDSIKQKNSFHILTTYKNNKCGIMDNFGNVLLKNDNEFVRYFNDYYFYRKNNKFFIQQRGNVVANELKYSNIQDIKDFLFVYNKNKYGVLDYTGKIIIPIIYDSIDEKSIKNFFSTGFLKVTKNGKELMIDMYNNEIDYKDYLQAIKNEKKYEFKYND